ncbi:hypothetical protein FB451DRAFT_1267731 [Mycena latifolia]|nr:hypothetical protein FB451DRAFT_1267731 [Mycena latifolia]
MTAVADLRRRLAELDAQIVEQQLVLDGLKRNRTATQHELHTTATYAVLSLPFEITARIFVHCLPLPDEFEDPWSSEVPMEKELQENAPLVLLGVCRAWRDIALGTPTLWSTLNIRFNWFPNSVASELGLIEGFIDRWLGRAGTCPLSLFLTLEGDEESETMGDGRPFQASRLRGIIHRHSLRLQHLELRTGEWEIGELHLNSGSFPILQSATFCWEPSPNLRETSVFSNAPRFNDFRVSCYDLEWSGLRYFSLPWLQLTKFEGEIDNVDLFRLAPNLTEVRIKAVYVDPDRDPPSTHTVITHSNLTSLTLTGADRGIGTLNALEYLSLPALQSLDISEAHETSYPSLEAFLLRSSPPLLSLSLSGRDDLFPHWHPCLSSVGLTLDNLVVQYPGDQVLVSIFRRYGTDLSALPNLRAISLLDVHRTQPLDFITLVNFLHGRQQSSGTLISFRLIWYSSPFLDLEMPLQVGEFEFSRDSHTIAGHLARMASAGMDIYIGTRDKNYAALDGDPVSPLPCLAQTF